MDDVEFDISGMARTSGLSPHTLRYYERVGLITDVRRAANGHRRYRAHDVAWVQFLNRLREMGMPIREMKLYAGLRAQGDSTLAERREMLARHHRDISDRVKMLNANLDVLETKIATYRKMEKDYEQR